ncbi:MAG: aspartate phosphatase [Gammaproteobacteria bacterium]|nr:aspartate phosphatase [Gammaproteobacteria bacterium]
MDHTSVTRTILDSPVVGRRLGHLLAVVFLLFGLLAVNGAYLGGITALEAATEKVYQDRLYLFMFLAHLVLGLALLPPFLVFGALHFRRARHRPNRYAIGAGTLLFLTGLVLLGSGLVLTRFGFFEVNDPALRSTAYWVHVVTPVAAIWLFVVHRLAGPPLRWRAGAAWAVAGLAAAAILAGGQAASRSQPPVMTAAHEPALVRTAGARIPARHLMQDAVCAECHADIAKRAAMGMHRFSSFNNPAYRFSVDLTREELMARDGDVEGARLCAVCHDQVPLFSGRFDNPDYDPDADPGAAVGIGCLGCHAITAVNSPRGNGAYDFADPPRYPFAASDNPLLQAVNRQLIKAKPAFHKATLLKPAHRTAEFCSTCHKVHLPYALNHYKWLRGQNHYDSFLLSGVSGHRVDSFYYPEQAVPNCAHCHMRPLPSDDPAARDFAGDGRRTVHDHLFGAANTGVPHMLGHPEWTLEARRQFLEGVARLDLFGIRDDGDIDGELHAPLRPRLPVLEPGRRYLLEAVVRTLAIGHQLTQGTTDSNELWLDVTVSSGGRVIGRSGALDPQGEVDPWSYFINSYLVDRHGNRIERRDAHNIFAALYDHQVPPGAAATVHYGFEVPPDVSAPVTIEARLRYRKFDSRFMGHMDGEGITGNPLPITTLATDRVTLPMAGVAPGVPEQSREVAAWERWNDYGIGLLSKGRRELRQAEAAFREVEALDPAHGATNLARVHYREGRLEEAAADLGHAAAAGAPPWVVAWLSARVEREFGDLDSAIARLEALVATRFEEARRRGFDFSRDYRVWNELGRTLFERARRERGAEHRTRRAAFLARARDALEQALAMEPENAGTHHNLALVYSALDDSATAARHRELHDRYRPNDHAVAAAVAAHRRRNPAADHAAEATAVYDLQRPGAHGLAAPARLARRAE